MLKEIRLFFLLICFSGILFFSDKKGLLKPLRGKIEQPILKTERAIYSLKISLTSFSNIFSSRHSLNDKVVQLEAEVQRLAVDQNQLSSCIEENEKLKKLLGAPLPAKWRFFPAKVVGVSNKMIIDKGEKDGVKEGMIVVSENILVGKVVSVHEYSSVVNLPETAGSKIPVVVKKPVEQGEDSLRQEIKARGLLIGQSGGAILERVLQEENIQKGDLVVSSGEEGWGGDLIIGQIADVLPKTAEIYQKALVKSFLDYKESRIVFLVII